MTLCMNINSNWISCRPNESKGMKNHVKPCYNDSSNINVSVVMIKVDMFCSIIQSNYMVLSAKHKIAVCFVLSNVHILFFKLSNKKMGKKTQNALINNEITIIHLFNDNFSGLGGGEKTKKKL